MGQLLLFKNGYNAAAEQYGSGVKFINVLDIIENDFITHDRIIGSVQIPPKDYEKNEIKYGDILFQRSSETREEVGQANVYLDQEKSATFGGFVIRGRPLVEFDSVFFNSMLKTEKARQDITSRSGGSTRYNIGQESLEAVVVSMAPTLPEQRKIADFLMAVDGRIGQLSQKKALLKDYKKGVMQQLFTQALRFKDDHGNDFPDWEEKPVEEMFTVTRGKVLAMPETKSLPTGEFRYPVYSSQTKSNGLAGYYDKFLFRDAITWTTDGANAGDVKFRQGEFYCTNVCGVLLSDKGYANAFVASILGTVTRQHVSYVGNPKLMNNIMSKISICVPTSIGEQTKIANFLTALDRKIESVSQQISHTQAFKKGLLQQMFV